MKNFIIGEHTRGALTGHTKNAISPARPLTEEEEAHIAAELEKIRLIHDAIKRAH